ncbi:phosphonoacetaldehyde hydrolase [Olsenella uli]|uniref:phosphonoacetaldehyde hydrolase n=1 Tax=Olsenella uli TaxID=133926 RepID=UPI00195987B1|nr:phosphonoacetaldehyde hydrolase [Olsenella uli]MBM6815858.1 phosphonoacetaldehyde hydrolase [Olsenella uli]
MVEAVIFDWAGTTVDYGCFAPVQAFIETFRAAGVEPTMEETRAPMGMLKIDHIRAMLAGERIKAEWERVHGHAPDEGDVQALYIPYEERLLSILDNFATPKPHVLEAVSELRAAGVKIGSTTGYNDKMMAIVEPCAAEQGYRPDFSVTPDAVGGHGRPYPYMIFRNMEALGCSDVRRVAKVGDTVSDVREGLAAGVISISVIEGSSEMGLSQAEYEALSTDERDVACERVAATFRAAGATAVIRAMAELPALLAQLA